MVQFIDEKVKINLTEDNDFIMLSIKYIKEEIVDLHFEKAKHKEFYLGYNECALPLILVHNTPNNTMPLLWWVSKNKDFVGLFPRVTRHK